MNNKFNKIISILFCVLIFAVLFVSITFFPFKNLISILTSIVLLIILISIFILYQKSKITKRLLYIFMIMFFLFGILIRIYFIEKLNFKLSSDFALAFNTGKDIANGIIPSESGYLSYNGYFYIFSYLVSIIFKIFGIYIKPVLYVNTFLQVFSLFFFYKIISIKCSRETSMFFTLFYFLLPSLINLNLLITTENPFFLMLYICIYISLKLLDKKKLTINNFILYLLLGFLLSFTNYIRPAVIAYIIIYIFKYIMNIKKFKEILLIGVLLISFIFTNILFNNLIEKGLNQSTRSGATGWSVYFGTNYNSNGYWTEEDSKLIFDILQNESKGNIDLLKLSYKRISEYGFIKTIKLILKKYNCLWSKHNATSDFVNIVLKDNNSKTSFKRFEDIANPMMQLSVILLSIINLYGAVRKVDLKNEVLVLFQGFGTIYIIGNIFVCVNGRYAFLLYPILIICGAFIIDNLILKNKKAKS